MAQQPAGRSYLRFYEGVQRRQHHEYLQAAVERAGGRVLWSSGSQTAPLFLAVADPNGSVIGLVAYVFLANRRDTRNRPQDEHRMQIRYGDVNDAAWRTRQHPVCFDPAGVDVTVVVGAHPEADLLVALDPATYDPLPLGISVFFKHAEIDEAARTGWLVWERDNISGARRASPRTQLGVETMIALAPERLFDLIALERRSRELALDPPLRFRAALRATEPQVDLSQLHQLEKEFDLTADEILELIGQRSRLAMAVRGGVAEHHLGRLLNADRWVSGARVGHQEGPPDFFVSLASGAELSVEVKNASPKRYADGTPKVEVQKTRAAKGNPASRLYRPDAFDVLAACMYGPTGRWEFRFKRSDQLARHPEHPDRITPLQRIDSTWFSTLADAIDG